MPDGCSVTRYIGLLARALIDADQELMREFGDRVAEWQVRERMIDPFDGSPSGFA
jgi:hypothetical protein